VHIQSNCYSILFTNNTGYTQSNKSRAKVLIHIILRVFIAVYHFNVIFVITIRESDSNTST